jgi:6-phosphogluconolactonase (cycloisomerase 2 family)
LLAACGGGGSDDGAAAGGGAGGGGGGGGGTAATPTFAYVANQEGTLSVFTVDTASGVLGYHGYDVASGANSLYAVARHPSGKYLYALAGNRIYAFWIDADNGALTAVNDLPGSGNFARTLTMNADGSVIYVADRQDDSIHIYSVDAGTGALTSMGDVNTGQSPYDVALHPNGSLLYSVNRDDNDVTVFPINGDGTLGASSTAHTDTAGTLDNLTFTPSGDYAYLGIGTTSNNLKRFAVDPGSGALTFIETITAGNGVAAFELNAAGTFAYAVSRGSDRVEVYSVAGDGALTNVQSINTGDQPDNLAFGPGETTLHVGNQATHEVSSYTVAADGRLTHVGDTRTRDDVWGIAIKAGTGTVSYRAERVYVPHPGDDVLYTLPIGADGMLGAPSMMAVGARPRQLTFHPGGKYAYLVDGDEMSIRAYTVDTATGGLSANGTVTVAAADGFLTRIAIDPSGRFLYALDNRADLRLNGRIFMFDIQADGTLIYNSAVNGGDGIYSGGPAPENLVIHPAGRYMYVMNSFGDVTTPGDNVTLFEIDRDDGDLTQRARFTGLDRALHAVIHPNGRYFYLTVENEQTLVKYYMRDDNGFLTSSDTEFQPSSPRADTRNVAVHPSGRMVYMTAADSTLAWYSTDANGNLAYVGKSGNTDTMEWIALTPDGKYLYGVSEDGIQMWSVDATTRVPSYMGRSDLTGLGAYQRTLTIDRVR